MKRFLILALLLIISLVSCKKEFQQNSFLDIRGMKLDTLNFTHSMKGWELYSWPVNAGWRYSFLIGTNRLKTLQEVYDNPLTVTGEDSLKAILNKLPENEEVFWISSSWLGQNWASNFGALQLPPRIIQLDIKEFCEKRKIKLTITE